MASTTNEYHKFPLFPKEIRHLIWKAASNQPRNVTIALGRRWIESQKITCIIAWQLPAVLHTCHESRTEALRSGYTLVFRPVLKQDIIGPLNEVKVGVYMNFEADTICLLPAQEEYLRSINYDPGVHGFNSVWAVGTLCQLLDLCGYMSRKDRMEIKRISLSELDFSDTHLFLSDFEYKIVQALTNSKLSFTEMVTRVYLERMAVMRLCCGRSGYISA